MGGEGSCWWALQSFIFAPLLVYRCDELKKKAPSLRDWWVYPNRDPSAEGAGLTNAAPLAR